MSVWLKPSTVDGCLQEVFGAPVPELYETATRADASPAITRALELRSFLALAEEQVARVRDRVHDAMAPDRDMSELSAEDLRLDAQWLDAALDAHDGYRAALDDLLRTMPSPGQPWPVQLAQHKATTTLPPAVAAPAPQRAGAARARRL
ncbi:hypothetical protein NLX86_25975 [Streptomyces sp. A3M-1-3]|uniref:hypothetical protein n=1 Tax=Streptomyces sp. A3M-1-3 TaxID=2962044 RepID=UPI0020B8481F|nr:hypothetical protein [Streptomyces sp. A3M-1-3]MCP3821419.1 hypothetical protein [Streptomyces sp. A3M-1-3]